jgi:hypothetical protein
MLFFRYSSTSITALYESGIFYFSWEIQRMLDVNHFDTLYIYILTLIVGSALSVIS